MLLLGITFFEVTGTLSFKEIAKYLVSHNIETTSCRALVINCDWTEIYLAISSTKSVQNLYKFYTKSVQNLYKICTYKKYYFQ